MSNRHAPQRIVLIGMPGSGKTAVSRILARRLGPGWRSADTDDAVVERDGRRIEQIFRESGEATFRRAERQAITALEHDTQVVIATGGGAVLDPENRHSLWRDALVVYLKARPETLTARVKGSHANSTVVRPLLEGADPLRRIEQLLAERGQLYDLADCVWQSDALYTDQIADEILRMHHRYGEQLVARPGRERAWQEPADVPSGPAAFVKTPSGSYPVYTGPGELDRLGERMSQAGLKGRATVMVDEAIASLYGEAAVSSLRNAGFDAAAVSVPTGEQYKHLGTVSGLYDRLLDRRSERGDAVVALGGGVTTDMAGLVAATYLRGVPLVHVPTSLLGMVDAAIGGKVGVDHERGKNLIGAFYQPRLVVADVGVLRTLSPRHLTEGWAEVIKHALIMDPTLLEALERDAGRIVALDLDAVTPVLRRSARLKAKVVSADEREDGPRMTLNYGHTIGHAIEAATHYSAVLHGEGVAVGMQGAARIAVELGVLSPDVAARQRRVIELYGLPLRWPGVDVEAVLSAMAFDKKVAARKQRWVLLAEVGRTVIRDDVPAGLVRETVAGLLAS